MPYRSLAPLPDRERLTKLAVLRELEATFTEAFWNDLAPELGIRRWVEAGRSGDLLAAIETHIRSLEEILHRWASIERTWEFALPGPLPSGEGQSHDLNVEAVSCRARLSCALAEMRPRFPITARTAAFGRGACWSLASAVPRGVGAFTIEPEGFFDGFRKRAGVLNDIEVNDPTFDGIFLVRGHEPTVRAVLRPPLRRILLRLAAKAHRLEVRVARGVATLDFRGPPETTMVADAIEALEHLRRAPIRALRIRGL